MDKNVLGDMIRVDNMEQNNKLIQNRSHSSKRKFFYANQKE